MMSFGKVFIAFGVYAFIHSLMLSEFVRHGLEAAFGPRTYRGAFRVGFNAVAVVLFLFFLGYAADQPAEWEVSFHGWLAVFFWLVRIAGVLLITWSMREVGLSRFLGLDNLRAWRSGESPPGEGVEGGHLVASGPYRWLRHPMYAGTILFLWGNPEWSGRYLGFCAAATLYVWVGARREEQRLRKTFGPVYAEYSARIPGFLPRRLRRRRG